MKKCKDCHIEKNEKDFYRSQGECKDCTKKRVRLRELALSKKPGWYKEERKRHREKYHRLNYREKHKPTAEMKKATMDRYKKKYPEKIDAHLAVLSKGIKSPEGINYHHWSYHKQHQLDWIELKSTDHFKLHRYITYDQERMMYRALDGVLLDTREKHVAYFEKIKNLE